MRPLALVLSCVLLTPAPSARAQHRPSVEPVSDARIDRLERWLKAVARHRPGLADPESFAVGSWSQPDLQALWIDVDVLVKMMRNPGSLRFTMRMTGPRTPRDLQRTPQDILYTKTQLGRIKAMACAAVGIVADPHCRESKASIDLDAELRRLSELAVAARLRGDGDNDVLRRGALLHADVAMLVARAEVEPVPTFAQMGPERLKMEISDGRQTDFGQVAVHWEIARMVLDYLKPANAATPAPERDAMVRQWYRATAAWMQHVEDHDTVHLDRARQMFPTDPDILFLSGAQRDTYASSRIQSGVRSAVLPVGVSFALGSEHAELRQAEGFFRRALESKPDYGEARLRLGRVLGSLGRHVDAARELRQALASVDDDLLRYYGELFLGAEEESLGQYDAAFDAYHRAAALSPTAQSPWLALSQLARRRGDRAAALRALQQVFDLPSEPDRDDPWWTYYVAQGRNVDQLFEDLRRPFLVEHEP